MRIPGSHTFMCNCYIPYQKKNKGYITLMKLSYGKQRAIPYSIAGHALIFQEHDMEELASLTGKKPG